MKLSILIEGGQKIGGQIELELREMLKKTGFRLFGVVIVLVMLFLVGCGVPIQRGEREEKSEKVRVAYLWVAGMTTVLYIYLVSYSGKH